MKLNDKEKQAIGRLLNNTDFQQFVEIVHRAALEQAEKAATHHEPPLIYRAQGGYGFGSWIVKQVEQVRTEPAKPVRKVGAFT